MPDTILSTRDTTMSKITPGVKYTELMLIDWWTDGKRQFQYSDESHNGGSAIGMESQGY